MTTDYFALVGTNPTEMIMDPASAYRKLADYFARIVSFHENKKEDRAGKEQLAKARAEWEAVDLSEEDIEACEGIRKYVNSVCFDDAEPDNIKKLAGFHKVLSLMVEDLIGQLKFELQSSLNPTRAESSPGTFEDAKEIRTLAEAVEKLAKGQGKFVDSKVMSLPKGKRASDDSGRNQRVKLSTVLYTLDDSPIRYTASQLARHVSTPEVPWTFSTLLEKLKTEHGVSLFSGWTDDDVDGPVTVNDHTIHCVIES